jgi:RecA/RadA recombinase
MPSKTERLRNKLTAPKTDAALPFHLGLSSGSTLINLACSGRPDVAFLPGNYALWVGDSGSGKSFITLTTLAEAAINPAYKDYRILFHNAENGALFDLDRFLPPLVKRMEPLMGSKASPDNSVILEDYWAACAAAVKSGPCVVLTDSMDALIPKAWLKKQKEIKKASAKGEDAGGSYGTDKAKLNSEHLRGVVSALRETGSILIMISQSRDRIGFGSQFDPKTRGGGNALTFYSHTELWTSVVGKLTKTVRGRAVEQGIICRVKCKKNRVNGRKRTVDVPILHSHGVDDLGGCVDWLVGWKHWNEKGGKIAAPEFDFDGSREKLIAMLEEDEQEDELRQLVTKVWNEIESACEVHRKSRYS